MTMRNFYVIMLNFKSGAPPTEQIEKLLDKVTIDWLRFAANQYIAYYDGDSKPLSDAIRRVISPDANILVLPVSLHNRSGWASILAVNWLKKHVP